MILNTVKEHWLGLRYRDQRAIILMALIIVPLLVFYLAIAPLNQSVIQATSLQVQRQTLHDWMYSVGLEAKAKLQTPKEIARQPITNEQQLSALVLRVAGQTGIIVQKYERDNDGGIRVWFDDVQFDGLMRFVAVLSDNDVVPQSFTVDAGKTLGAVQARGVWSVQSL